MREGLSAIHMYFNLKYYLNYIRYSKAKGVHVFLIPVTTMQLEATRSAFLLFFPQGLFSYVPDLNRVS